MRERFIKYREGRTQALNAPIWNETSGLSPAELREQFSRLDGELSEQPYIRRRAELFAFLLNHAQVCADPRDVFAEKLRHESLLVDLRERWRAEVGGGALRAITEECGLAHAARAYDGAQDYGHAVPDWQTALALGFPGLLLRVQNAKQSAAPGQTDFYDACETVLTATLAYVRRVADEAARVADDTESHACAERLSALAERAPQTLPEAYQFMDLVYVLMQDVEGENLRSMGRLDQLLLPYFRGDLKSGRYTRDELFGYTQFFYDKLRSYAFSANIPFTLGGVDADGRDAVNELSYFFVEVYRATRVHDPKLQIRVCPETPDAFLEVCLDCVREGLNSFVFINDPNMTGALEALGCSRADARDCVLIGCYEPGARGELPRTCAGSMSLAKAAELALFDGVDPLTGARLGPEVGMEFASYEEYEDAVMHTIDHMAERTMAIIRAWEPYAVIGAAPFFSSMLPDCVEHGTDVYAGGTRYNNASINAFGLATAADTLAAVRQLVYEEKSCTLDELRTHLRSNWQDAPLLRQKALHRCPKYGNGDPSADDIARRITDRAARDINGQPNTWGGVFRLGMFSIDWNVDFGHHTGATPDGRESGEPLSKNLCAAVGCDRSGLTALLRSAAVPAEGCYPNGSVLDMTLHPTMAAGESGMEAMVGLTRGYFRMGGFGIQFNVFDAETLRKAKAHPEQYQTLQVRVCGWNAYFVTLTPEDQEIFIRRAEHVCA